LIAADPTQLTASYNFDLPPELIAQRPVEPRDSARLLTLIEGGIGHATFADLPSYLREGDVLVVNDTRVIAARIAGRRPSGGRVEILLLRPAAGARYDPNALRWVAMVKPARRLKAGARIEFNGFGAADVVREEDEGVRELEFTLEVPFETFLQRAGRLPLPPYVREDSEAAQRGYQTVFAREPGSVAAPTASLHFTKELLERLERDGVRLVRLNLNVGLGTFKPMQTQRIGDHRMHSESFFVPETTAAEVEAAKREGRRVIAAGTTVVRALEGSAVKHGTVRPGFDETDLFIRPGYRFAYIDAMITNFHLPRSTLLALVCAFAGRERIMRAYHDAIERRYRFFSFGDAMLIEP